MCVGPCAFLPAVLTAAAIGKSFFFSYSVDLHTNAFAHSGIVSCLFFFSLHLYRIVILLVFIVFDQYIKYKLPLFCYVNYIRTQS